MQLIFIAHRCGAAFQIGHIRAFVGNNQRTLKLAGFGFVDTEIGGQLHWAAYTFGDIHKGAVRKHRAIKSGVIVVTLRHHSAEVFFHQLRVLMHGFGNGHKNNTGFSQLGAEGGGNGYRVKNRIHRDAGQRHLLMQRNTQFFVGAQQLRVNFIEAFRFVGHAFGGGIVGHRLKVDFRVVHVRPGRLCHFLPDAEGFQTPFGHPFRLALLSGDKAHHVFIQTGRNGVGLNVGDESGLVVVTNAAFDFGVAAHSALSSLAGLKDAGILTRFRIKAE